MSLNSIGSNIPIEVAKGGTGASSFNAYAPITAGSTSTDPLQSDSVLTSGYALTSNGPGFAPVFVPQYGGVKILQSINHAPTSTSVVFDAFSSTYTNYMIQIGDPSLTTLDDVVFVMTVSDDGGSSYYSTGYFSSIFKYSAGGVSVSTDTTRMILSKPYEITTNPIGPQVVINLNNVTTTTTTTVTGTSSWYSKTEAAYSGAQLWATMPANISINAVKFQMLQSGGAAASFLGYFRLFGLSQE